MSYEKPICDCGNALKVKQIRILEELYTISENGYIVKDNYFNTEVITNLNCSKCNNSYEIQYKNNNVLTRGKLIGRLDKDS